VSEIKRQLKGNLGMFLVCAKLSELNLIAMPTIRNTQGYDIIALNPESNGAVGIQVKTTNQPQKGFLVLSTHWRSYQAMVEEKIVAPFVFVDISELDKPAYFILSKEDLKRTLKSAIARYVSDYQQRHSLSWEEMLEKEQREKRKPNAWALFLSDIKNYQNNWQAITGATLVRG